jgi:hypothetical protein
LRYLCFALFLFGVKDLSPPTLLFSTHTYSKFLRERVFYNANAINTSLVTPKITWEPWNASRLTFSTSPYPPREEWKTSEGGFGAHLDELRFWEWRSFCAGQMEKVEEGEGVIKRVGTWVRKVDRWAAGFI